uniref:Integrase core domain containing protein n=1 Tax=Solanum tuberosum TaxID=4113 RepID=M1DYP4_SOLTU
MARPKVVGRNDPPRHVGTREFRKEEKRVEMPRQRKYTKEARKKRRIPFDLNIRPCDRSLVNAMHALRASQEIDLMIAANLATETKAKANNGNQNDNAPMTITLLQKDAPGTDAQTDGATA